MCLSAIQASHSRRTAVPHLHLLVEELVLSQGVTAANGHRSLPTSQSQIRIRGSCWEGLRRYAEWLSTTAAVRSCWAVGGSRPAAGERYGLTRRGESKLLGESVGGSRWRSKSAGCSGDFRRRGIGVSWAGPLRLHSPRRVSRASSENCSGPWKKSDRYKRGFGPRLGPWS